MRRLMEIILLCGLATSHYMNRYAVELMPIYLMSGLIFCMLTELPIIFEKNRNWQIIPILIYAVLCLWHPPLLIFLPMLLYSVFARWGIGSFLLVLLYRDHLDVISLVISIVAAYFSYRSVQFGNYARQSLRISDELKQQMISLEQYNTRLEENAVKSREFAKLEERNRIAGELHDSLGHTISSSILQIEALKLTEPDIGKKEKLQLLQDILSNGMTDIRKQIHGMYDSSFSLNEKLEKLVINTPNIKVKIQNMLTGELSFDKKNDIYAIIRQALANTLKHSDATHFTAFLKEQGRNQILLITDNGSKEPEEMSRYMGLSAMEDIAQKYNGKLNYYYYQGFHIHMVLSEEN